MIHVGIKKKSRIYVHYPTKIPVTLEYLLIYFREYISASMPAVEFDKVPHENSWTKIQNLLETSQVKFQKLLDVSEYLDTLDILKILTTRLHNWNWFVLLYFI